MSPQFNITLRAKTDLNEIWNYTFDAWSEAQADKYVTALYNRFKWLSEQPTIGKHRPDIESEYYCFSEGEHLIFYIINNTNNISIVGVPYKKMDIINYFNA